MGTIFPHYCPSGLLIRGIQSSVGRSSAMPGATPQMSVSPWKAWGKRKKPQLSLRLLSSGAEGDRTPDLLNAIQARSQLRHSPSVPSQLIKAVPGCQPPLREDFAPRLPSPSPLDMAPTLSHNAAHRDVSARDPSWPASSPCSMNYTS